MKQSFGEIEGYNNLEAEGRSINFTNIWVDAEFINLYDLKLVKGRFFTEEMRKHRNATALLNEALVIAFVIACPVAWFIMRKWLDNFAYKTDISPWIFMASGLIVSVIASTIVSGQSWRFANRNPAETL